MSVSFRVQIMILWQIKCEVSKCGPKQKAEYEPFHTRAFSTRFPNTVELQWLEHLWEYENLFETGVVRAIEGLL